jgi:hypothetical protein
MTIRPDGTVQTRELIGVCTHCAFAPVPHAPGTCPYRGSGCGGGAVQQLASCWLAVVTPSPLTDFDVIVVDDEGAIHAVQQ